MADIYSLITDMRAEGEFERIATNPAAQLGTPSREYLGTRLLPEMMVEENMFEEDAVRYRTVIANDGTRYSPAQKKGSALVGTFDVKLANQDIALELTGREYDILIRLLNRNASVDAMAQIAGFVDRANLGLVEKSELQRWQAIVDASVPLSGDNAYSETVTYSNPSGHRAAAGDSWTDDTYDPFTDILAMANLLRGKGFNVARIITSTPVLTILANNAKVQARTGVTVVNVGGSLQVANQVASQAAISGVLQADGLPAIETYDLQYMTQSGSGYFLKRDVFVMLATTGRDAQIDLADLAPVVPLTNTRGYTAIGRGVGQAAPGRVLRVEAFNNKPPRVEVEAWQTSLPVILEPEAIAVITDID
jgi:hypothetical protein